MTNYSRTVVLISILELSQELAGGWNVSLHIYPTFC